MTVIQSTAAHLLPKRRWGILIPLFGLCMFFSTLDRYNISLILPDLQKALHLDAGQVGFATSAFFLGTVVFQIPVFLVLNRLGGRTVIAACLLIWSLASIASGLVHTPGQLFLARLIVGLGEAAFHPAMYLLITRWFLDEEKGRANTIFFAFGTAASIFSGPLTGLMLVHIPWQLVFVLQGLPTVVLAVVWLFLYSDQHTRVPWLSHSQAETIAGALEAERLRDAPTEHVSYWKALLNRRVVWLMVTFGLLGGPLSAFSIWLPSVIGGTAKGLSALGVGLVSAIPYIVAVVVSILLGRYADHTRRFRQALLIPAAVGTISLLVGPLVHGAPVVQLVLICLVAAGSLGIVPIFYAFPTWMLAPAVLPVALGLINTAGALVGFFSVNLVGVLTDVTGSGQIAIASLGILFAVGVVIAAIICTPPPVRAQTSTEPALLDSTRPDASSAEI